MASAVVCYSFPVLPLDILGNLESTLRNTYQKNLDNFWLYSTYMLADFARYISD